MKTTKTLTIVLLLMAYTYLAQIPNGGFESWTSGNPDQWGTSNSGLFQPVTQVSNSHGGASAMKMQPILFNGTTFGPIAYLTDTGDPFPYAGRPTSLRGWCISSFPTAGNYLEITGSLKKSGAVIGVINTSITATNSGYTEFIAPISYFQSGNSDSAYISIKMWSTNFGGLDPNAFVIIDDLAFSTVATGIDEFASQNGEMLQVIADPVYDVAKIEFSNSTAGSVKLVFCDLSGKVIKTCLDQNQPAGQFRTFESLETLEEGIYFVRLETPSGVRTQKFCVVR
ncbi:MAG: T9SS type A sorting domain-containing protein [Bacteroidia bacterium]|nr:T9SS type A sorting domain-containing protein [Bacteroidia bacterium]